MMTPRYFSVLLVILAGSGCTPDAKPTGSVPPPPDNETVDPTSPPDVEAKSVPTSPSLIVGKTECVNLNDGESLWSVSPEGHAWLVPEAPTSFRIVDPFALPVDEAPASGDDEEGASLNFEELTMLHAWSGAAASVIADGGLWQLDDLARTQIGLPNDVSEVTSLCGAPRDGGFLLSGGAVYERRAEQWWAWDPGVASAQAPHDIIPFGRECTGIDDAMWMSASDGTMWRLAPTTAEALIRFDDLRGAAATLDMLAVLAGEELWINTPPEGQTTLGQLEGWDRWRFSSPVPTKLSASAGALWMLSGDKLLRYDPQGFAEISHEMAETVTAVHAYSGGAWLAGETKACRISTAPMLRLIGTRPFAHTRLGEIPFAVEVAAGVDAPTATLGEAAIALDFDEESDLTTLADSAVYEGTLSLDGAGWQMLRLNAAGIERTVPLRQDTVDWATDIEPIFKDHCASCHGTETESPLATQVQWQGAAATICTQVLLTSAMPKLDGAAESGWNDDRERLKGLIQTWLQGENINPSTCEKTE